MKWRVLFFLFGATFGIMGGADSLQKDNRGGLPARMTLQADLEGDGKVETLVLDASRGQTLTVSRGSKQIWQGMPRDLKPWKLATSDVDGDGRREISLGVFKASRFVPQPHNCLFLYDWNGRAAVKKYLSSRLSRPFVDFAFGHLDADRADELVALEKTADGRLGLTVYHWEQFGFRGAAGARTWPQAQLIGVWQGKIWVNVDGRRVGIAPPRQGA